MQLMCKKHRFLTQFFLMLNLKHLSTAFQGINWMCSSHIIFPFQSLPIHPKINFGASLVAQWLGIRLPMQGTRVHAPGREGPTCRGATRPVSHNYWACASGACGPQRDRPRQWEARAPRWRVAPACHNWRKPSHRNEDPTQP